MIGDWTCEGCGLPGMGEPAGWVWIGGGGVAETCVGCVNRTLRDVGRRYWRAVGSVAAGCEGRYPRLAWVAREHTRRAAAFLNLRGER